MGTTRAKSLLAAIAFACSYRLRHIYLSRRPFSAEMRFISPSQFLGIGVGSSLADIFIA